MKYFPELAKNLRTLRETNGYSLDDLAQKSTFSKTYLWELENDKKGKKSPSAYVIWILALSLGTSIEGLLGVPDTRVNKPEAYEDGKPFRKSK